MAHEFCDTIHVCTDCYFAHHYGITWMSREANGDLFGPWTADERAELIGEHDWVWYAGDSDTPCDREPFGKIEEGYWVEDATCSNHEVTDCAMGVCDYHACPHCGHNDPDDGIDEFSSWSCHGCGSHLGGSRYRMSLWKETTNA
jgi:ribosomal protein L37AE/L43A